MTEVDQVWVWFKLGDELEWVCWVTELHRIGGGRTMTFGRVWLTQWMNSWVAEIRCLGELVENEWVNNSRFWLVTELERLNGNDATWNFVWNRYMWLVVVSSYGDGCVTHSVGSQNVCEKMSQRVGTPETLKHIWVCGRKCVLMLQQDNRSISEVKQQCTNR